MPTGKNSSASRKQAKNAQLFAIILLLLVLIVQTVILWRNGTLPQILQTAFPSVSLPTGEPGDKPRGPAPTPTPTKLKQGSETYTISQANISGPRITKLSLDPLDVKSGQTQTLTAHVVSTSAISSVSIEFQSDNKKRTLTLTPAGGSPQDGDWQTTWSVDDTMLYTYVLTISASSGGVTNSVIVAPRQ